MTVLNRGIWNRKSESLNVWFLVSARADVNKFWDKIWNPQSLGFQNLVPEPIYPDPNPRYDHFKKLELDIFMSEKYHFYQKSGLKSS